jgi:hypothetical protein
MKIKKIFSIPGSVLGLSLAIVGSLSYATTAHAADDKKKRTSIDFEDQLINGDVRKPELFYLLQKKQINFGRLIKLRENFLPELERTSEDVQRGSADE